MRAFCAIFVRESTEMGLALIVGLSVGTWLGLGTLPVGGLLPFDAARLVTCAAFVGAWQGRLDRRHVKEPFHRHRPVRALPFQGARWLSGLLCVSASFAAYLFARTIAARFADAATIDAGHRLMIAVELHGLQPSMAWGYAFAVFAWCLARVAVSWPGYVAPVASTVLLGFAFWSALRFAVPGYRATVVPLILLFSIFQGVRLAKGRPC